jgi:hypothetical protein
MNSFKRLANNKLVLAVGLIALLWFSPPGVAFRSDRADILVESAKDTDPIVSVGRMRVALWLHDNDQTANTLADKYLELGRPYEAVLLLKGRGDALKLRAAQIAFEAQDHSGALKIVESLDKEAYGDRLAAYSLLEIGHTDDAADIASKSSDTGAWRCIVLHAAERGGECADISLSVDASEASERLARLKAGKTAQAQEMLREKLYVSAEKLLVSIDKPNAEAAVLLASIRLSKPQTDEESLKETGADLKLALLNYPGDIELRRLYRDVLTKLNDKSAADEQQRLIDQLESGRV